MKRAWNHHAGDRRARIGIFLALTLLVTLVKPSGKCTKMNRGSP
jgi:hypothetical protein